MNWSDEGIVLSARKHGESAAIVTLLTRLNGRYSGLVHGGAGSRARGIYQTGNLVSADWRARLSEHLGSLTCELLRPHAAGLLNERLPLMALISASALVERLLPEREPHPETFDRFCALVESLGDGPDWLARYVHWELALLTDLGYGLDLSQCAATGAIVDLIYVSPRTGCAVSATAGEPYLDKLLKLVSALPTPWIFRLVCVLPAISWPDVQKTPMPAICPPCALNLLTVYGVRLLYLVISRRRVS
jgi:DNA repair protein RecO (recombination protein O)